MFALVITGYLREGIFFKARGVNCVGLEIGRAKKYFIDYLTSFFYRSYYLITL